MKIIILAGIFFFLCFNKVVEASLKINEIYPAPNTGEQEWVEIFNDEDKTIDLGSFALSDSKNTLLTFETNSASPSGYILVTGNNILNNSGDTVFLKNSLGEIVDSVTYDISFSSDKSYSRCNDSWIQTSTITKRDSNAASCILPTATNIPNTPAVTSVTTVTNVQSYDRIYISEVMVNPEDENEWIELYNDNDFDVSIKNWFIDDAENAGSSPKPLTIDIAAKSYSIYEIASSMFNNDTDAVRLLNENKITADAFSYYSSVNGLSIGKINPFQSSICITNPTKGYANGICVEIQPTNTPTPSPTPKPSPTITSFKVTITTLPTKQLTVTVQTTIKKLIRPTIHLPNSLYESTTSSIIKQSIKEKGNVLGVKTTAKKNEDNIYSAEKLLAVAGITLSFLTILKIFFRMKSSS